MPSPPTPASPPIAGLSRRRKAAMIVQMLISDGGKLSLSDLPESTQEALTRELGNLRMVDRATVQAVAQEFADLLESIGLTAPGGHAAAFQALAEHLSPALARKLRAEIEGRDKADPWDRVTQLDSSVLLRLFEAESLEIGAVVLSKLPVDIAAELLERMPGERARRVTIAVNQTEKIAPDTLARIGAALAGAYDTAEETAFEAPPDKRIGDILNSSPASTREELLAGLEESDEGLARRVRKAIFTFEDIPARMKPTDIPGVLRDIDADQLTTALAYALGAGGGLNEAAEHVLANISQRMATQMREDADEKGQVGTAAGEKALNMVTASIRAQVDAGTIKLLAPGDEIESAA